MISILNVNYAEHFGFTQPEVEQLLEAYGISNKKGEVRRWYDGYVFGKTEVYNPWSVLNYTKTAAVDKNAFPKPYWANTPPTVLSGNWWNVLMQRKAGNGSID